MSQIKTDVQQHFLCIQEKKENKVYQQFGETTGCNVEKGDNLISKEIYSHPSINSYINTFIININNNNKYFKQLKISTCTYQQYCHLHIWQNVLIILEVYEDLASTFDHVSYKQKDSTQLLEFED